MKILFICRILFVVGMCFYSSFQTDCSMHNAIPRTAGELLQINKEMQNKCVFKIFSIFQLLAKRRTMSKHISSVLLLLSLSPLCKLRLGTGAY